jgi:hypothetical protein
MSLMRIYYSKTFLKHCNFFITQWTHKWIENDLKMTFSGHIFKHVFT